MKVSVNQIIQQLLSNLPERQREILDLRYGLSGTKAATLAEIGEKYGVTRERIRQLESAALKEVHNNSQKTDLPKFIGIVASRLKELGGVTQEESLVNYLASLVGGNSNAIRFVLEISGSVFEHKEDDSFHTFWYLNDDSHKKALEFIDKLHQNLSEKRMPISPIKDRLSLNFVSVSKKFAVNPYGEFGLAEWSYIIPKNARDWGYLVLKKTNRPMHFGEIAEAITKLRSKKTNPQTVHNELIKYDEFVLVGKGTYALREHGYVPGIAKEVIERLIHQNGPLTSKAIVKLVLQERLFKENTVLINLQNKKRFRRLPDGRYATLA